MGKYNKLWRLGLTRFSDKNAKKGAGYFFPMKEILANA
jgi:hypothetical protein